MKYVNVFRGLMSTLAVFVLFVGSASAQTYEYPGLSTENLPLATGKPNDNGFFSFFEYVSLFQSRALPNNQVVAYRGLVDSLGQVTGLPGTYIGSGVVGLQTNDLPRGGSQIGFNVGFGYKTSDGTSIYFSYMRQFEMNLHAGATQVPAFFRTDVSLADTFLTSGVYNFPPNFAGPAVKTAFDKVNGLTNFYGLWNGASEMNIQYNQWFTNSDITVRTPLFETEYSRIYGLAGGRFDWFFERFKWETVDIDVGNGNIPTVAANYTNTLSQRMYGPFVGCGNEVYLGNSFALSVDTTGALLLDIIKERVVYELGDKSISNKMSRNEMNIVPSVTVSANLWWYPIEGVQLRVGYSAYMFFNTLYMDQPIGFNYNQPDPAYSVDFFRIVHGVNVGVGLFF